MRQTERLGDEVLDPPHQALVLFREVVVVEGTEVAITEVGRRQLGAGRAVWAHCLTACARNQKAAPSAEFHRPLTQ